MLTNSQDSGGVRRFGEAFQAVESSARVAQEGAPAGGLGARRVVLEEQVEALCDIEQPPEDGGPLHAPRKAAPQREDVLVVPDVDLPEDVHGVMQPEGFVAQVDSREVSLAGCCHAL